MENYNMPIYEYRCSKCGTEFEELVTSSEADVKCKKCGKNKTERKLSTFSAKVAGNSTCSMANACPGASNHACGSGGCCGGH